MDLHAFRESGVLKCICVCVHAQVGTLKTPLIAKRHVVLVLVLYICVCCFSLQPVGGWKPSPVGGDWAYWHSKIISRHDPFPWPASPKQLFSAPIYRSCIDIFFSITASLNVFSSQFHKWPHLALSDGTHLLNSWGRWASQSKATKSQLLVFSRLS